MRTAMAFVAVAVVAAAAGCAGDQPVTDQPTPPPETTTTTGDAGDTTRSSAVAEPATTAETTTTVPEESTTTAETTTTTTVTDQPWAGPSFDGEWVEVAAGEPWGPALPREIAALPGGGFVTVTLESGFADIAEEDGFPISTVMWSPDGVEWFDGDPERALAEIERPFVQLAVAGDRVAVVGRVDFSDHVPLAIGDPRTGSWSIVALDDAALKGHEGRVSGASLAANDDEVLVAANLARDAGTTDVVTWVVDPTTGSWETGSYLVGADPEPRPEPRVAWVDGRWIVFAYEDYTGLTGQPDNTLWTSADGLAWSQADLPSGLGGVSSIAVGPMGAVVVTDVWWGGDGRDWYSADGLEWTDVPQVGKKYRAATAVGDYGFVMYFVMNSGQEDPEPLQLLAPDGSGVYQMSGPFDDFIVAASSGDTLLVSSGEIFSGFWLYTPS